jgi:uncharacterized protein (DUF1778 family)
MGGFGSGHGSGGARPGAGRPKGKKTADTVFITFRVSKHERETLRKRAATAGMSVSEFIKVSTLSSTAK